MSLIQLFDYGIEVSNGLLLSLILLLPVIGTGAMMLINKPCYFETVGMMLGVLLNIPYLFLLNILAETIGWWEYGISENSFYNIPVEIVLGWAFFWGAFLPLLFKHLPLIVPVIVAVLLDIWLMPQMNGLFALGENWLVGEAVMIIVCLIPSLLIFKLTMKRRQVLIRALIQSYIWGGWVVFLIPAIVLHFESKYIFSILDWSPEWIIAFISGMAVSMAIGYAGLWEFATKGNGTPIPFDPPQKLVTKGIYAHVANPLQVSTLLMFICIAIAYQSWLMIGPMIAHIFYCEVFVRWHHFIDIEERFGEEWFAYKAKVRNWLPTIKRYECA